MNKYELLRRVKALEIDPETKEAIVKFVGEHKKFGLVWEDKSEAVEQRLENELPVLDEVVERAVLYKNSPPCPHKNSPPSPPFAGGEKETLFAREKEIPDSPPDKGGGRGGTLPTRNSRKFPPDKGGVGGEFLGQGGNLLKVPDHILIEGDNLHALTCLAFTHERAVDVIYIDPPYNTGNKDFRYNDRYVDKEDGYRHSKWLSFMHKRLRLAKKLLKDTGVIFISIDDNEQAPLKLLCDGLFGGENFVANIVWKKKTGAGNQIDKVFDEHEYVLVYTKNKDIKNKWRIKNKSDGNFNNPDNDIRGRWESCAITAPSKNQNPNQLYAIEIFFDNHNPYISYEQETILENFKYKNHTILFHKNIGETVSYQSFDVEKKNAYFIRRWAYIPSSMKEIFNLDKVYLNNGNLPRYKKFEDEYEGKALRSIYFEEFSTQQGSNEVASILLNATIFAYPKPLNLIKLLVNASSPTSALVLDFFAGSGTTLHAVMQLNAEDGGSRQCILVTDNENGIAEEVCYERCKRVIQGYTNAKGAQVAGLSRNNLRYYRTGFVDTSLPSFGAKREITRRATGMLCIRHGCYTELPATTRDGLVSADVIRLFGDKGTEAGATCRLLIVYDEDGVEDAVQVVKQIPRGLPIYVYVFSPSYDPYTEDFWPVIDRIRLLPIPDAIYNAYKFARRHGVSDSPPVSEAE